MKIFGGSLPCEEEIEKATNEKNTNEPWDVIMNICDNITTNPVNAKDCLKVILKRLANPDPHVAIQAVTLLDACANNCGKPFHLEIASREFENEYKRLITKSQPSVMLKMLQLIKKWAENDFKNDPELNLIPSFYHKLKSEGFIFTSPEAKQKQKVSAQTAAALKDPNVVSSQQEEDDIAKAIELSLKETKNSPKRQSNSGGAAATGTTNKSYPSLYPSFAPSSPAKSEQTSAPEPRKVRALYDFEAAEENELTFKAGEIIHVLDDSDPNWWKGYNQKGEGLFPSNFVTADLSVEPERFEQSSNAKGAIKKSVQFEDDKTDKSDTLCDDLSNLKLESVIDVQEEKIDRLLHLLHEANPEDPSQDTEEMLRLEHVVNQMGPLIDTELERVDRKHAQLTQLSSDLVDAINLYHTLMREPERTMPGAFGASIPMNYNFPGIPTNYEMQQPNQIYGPQNLYTQAPMVTTTVGAQSMPPIFQQQHLQGSVRNNQLQGQYKGGAEGSLQPNNNNIPQSLQYAPTISQQQPQTAQPNNFPIQQNLPPTQFQVTPIMYPSNTNAQQFPQQHQHPQDQMNGMTTNGTIGSPPNVSNSSGIPLQFQQPNSLPLMGMMMGPGGLPHPQYGQMNQSVTQTILGGQNDPKTNIPIYQQQR